MNGESLDRWANLAVQRLRSNLDPEQIILFGSWARGTATRHALAELTPAEAFTKREAKVAIQYAEEILASVNQFLPG